MLPMFGMCFLCVVENDVKLLKSKKPVFFLKIVLRAGTPKGGKPSKMAKGRVGTELGGDNLIFIKCCICLGRFVLLIV
jgi:hypothetical protein